MPSTAQRVLLLHLQMHADMLQHMGSAFNEQRQHITQGRSSFRSAGLSVGSKKAFRQNK